MYYCNNHLKPPVDLLRLPGENNVASQTTLPLPVLYYLLLSIAVIIAYLLNMINQNSKPADRLGRARSA